MTPAEIEALKNYYRPLRCAEHVPHPQKNTAPIEGGKNDISADSNSSVGSTDASEGDSKCVLKL